MYNIIIMNPKLIMENKHTMQWWMTLAFTKQILNFIYDEAHCIQQWGMFQKEYLRVGNLQCIISNAIPFYAASAMLPLALTTNIMDLLHICKKGMEKFLLSNDHPDLWLMAQPLIFPVNSYKDLAFLIPDGVTAANPPPKFIVFFDKMKKTQEACKWLQNHLPADLRSRIRYFHSTMTQDYKEGKVDALSSGFRQGSGMPR